MPLDDHINFGQTEQKTRNSYIVSRLFNFLASAHFPAGEFYRIHFIASDCAIKWLHHIHQSHAIALSFVLER